MSRTAADVERLKLEKRERRKLRKAMRAAGKMPALKPAKSLDGKAWNNPNSRANLIAPWTPETAPRNGGRPKSDMAAIIARAIFDNNPKLIYDSMAKELAKGSAYAYEKLAERGFGKLKEQLQLSGTEEMVSRLAAGRKRAMEKEGSVKTEKTK